MQEQGLGQKRIVLGITGGIAAYKSAELVRRLREQGADVRVVMTESATRFITPLTLQALSGHPVHLDLFDAQAEAAMGHIELARWADLLLIAPATQANLALLQSRGVCLFGPGAGSQACGEVGPGRMLEAAQIVQLTSLCFAAPLLAGKRVLITAGPTQESIDPVRYISNHSSGKMGFALATAAAQAGAEVWLIAGPVHLPTPAGVKRFDVKSARDMLAACEAAMPCDVLIAAAAVADYHPQTVAAHKLKKNPQNPEGLLLQLVCNPDILATLAKREDHPFCVGFAAETEQMIAHAQNKRAHDGAQERSDIGFNSEDNAVTVIDRAGGQIRLGKAPKTQIARQLIELITKQMQET